MVCRGGFVKGKDFKIVFLNLSMNKKELLELLDESINDLIGGESGFEKNVSKYIRIHEEKTHAPNY